MTTMVSSWALGITGALMFLLGSVTLAAATPVLYLTHLACFLAGVAACWPLRRLFRARVVDGHTVFEYRPPSCSRSPRSDMFRRLFNRETAVSWVVLLAAASVFLIGWKSLDAVEENANRIRKLECDDAWLWLSIVAEARTEERDPGEGPRTPAEEARLDRFEAQYRAKVEELDCPPPGDAKGQGSSAMTDLFGTTPVVTVVRQSATSGR